MWLEWEDFLREFAATNTPSEVEIARSIGDWMNDHGWGIVKRRTEDLKFTGKLRSGHGTPFYMFSVWGKSSKTIRQAQVRVEFDGLNKVPPFQNDEDGLMKRQELFKYLKQILPDPLMPKKTKEGLDAIKGDRPFPLIELSDSERLSEFFKVLEWFKNQVEGLEPFGYEEELELERDRIEEAGEFNPSDMTDARRHVFRSIADRQGRKEFRDKLLHAYSGKCAVTNCDAEPALEAAHIHPYAGPQTNHVTNGLLLRSDIHTLFDLKLLSIDPDSMRVVLSRRLSKTCYTELDGKKIRLPDRRETWPKTDALRQRHEELLDP